MAAHNLGEISRQHINVLGPEELRTNAVVRTHVLTVSGYSWKASSPAPRADFKSLPTQDRTGTDPRRCYQDTHVERHAKISQPQIENRGRSSRHEYRPGRPRACRGPCDLDLAFEYPMHRTDRCPLSNMCTGQTNCSCPRDGGQRAHVVLRVDTPDASLQRQILRQRPQERSDADS